MYDKQQRPSEVIAFQRKVIEDQEAIIATLKGALAAAGGEVPSTEAHPFLSGLTQQESALVGALFRCYPRVIDKYELLEFLPGYDHVEERQAQVVTVKVCHLRKKLGADAVECVFGRGYRLGERVYEALREREASPAARPQRRAEPHLRLAA